MISPTVIFSTGTFAASAQFVVTLRPTVTFCFQVYAANK